MSVNFYTTLCHIQENNTLHSHFHENVKSCFVCDLKSKDTFKKKYIYIYIYIMLKITTLWVVTPCISVDLNLTARRYNPEACTLHSYQLWEPKTQLYYLLFFCISYILHDSKFYHEPATWDLNRNMCMTVLLKAVLSYLIQIVPEVIINVNRRLDAAAGRHN
jgi:hypothetical protein